MIDGGSAADHGSGGDVVRDAALGNGYGAVSYFDVAAAAYLSGQDHVVAYVGGAGEANLGAEQGVVSDDAAVADVDHVVDLRAAPDAGLSDAGTIDAGVGLDLDVALERYVAGLNDFVPVRLMGVLVLGEAEAVGANDGAILQEHIVSELAEFADYGVGVGKEIVADLGVAVDDGVGQEDSVVSDDGVFVDDYVGSEVGVFAEPGCGMDDRGGVDSGGIARWLVEEFDGFGPSQIRILAAEHSRVNSREVVRDYNGGGLRRFCSSVVFGIADEGELSAGGVFYGGYSGDLGFWGDVFQGCI